MTSVIATEDPNNMDLGSSRQGEEPQGSALESQHFLHKWLATAIEFPLARAGLMTHLIARDLSHTDNMSILLNTNASTKWFPLT